MQNAPAKPTKQIELLPTPLNQGDNLKALHTPELVIALCGPIGSPLHDVASALKTQFKEKYGYSECEQIQLSKFIEKYSEQNKITIPKNPFERIRKLIKVGNEMRGKHGSEILAKLAIKRLAESRQRNEGASNDEDGAEPPNAAQGLSKVTAPRRVVHIIDSVKNQSELEILRLVYGDMLYMVGVYAPLDRRVANLQKQRLSNSEVAQLIDLDSGEEIEYGQTVRQTFPYSDYFLRVEERTHTELVSAVDRFINLILGARPETPTVHEMAMYAAASAAGHSACLSRQVGACVTSAGGDILAMGWNDVPRFGGGLYVSGEDVDKDLRCWNKDGGKCFNDEEKDLLTDRVSDALITKNLVQESDRDKLKQTLRNETSVKDLIEFSRAIHAEMHAIMRGLQAKGSSVLGGRLYVTTYPCHSCARHIIAAGIKEVYFIEPYRKSLAIRLHDDAMTEEETSHNKVVLRQYHGVAPRRFLSIFKTNNQRKDKGILVVSGSKIATPVVKLTLEAIPRLEAMVVEAISTDIRGLSPT